MITTAARPRRIGGLASAAALASTALIGGWASSAGAHEGGSIIEVDGAHEVADGIHFVVEVTYEDDGHGAPDAVVTATASGPDGAEVGPVTLEVEDDEAGLYGGVLELTEPGDWDVTFASLDPDGTLEHTETVEADAGAADEGDAEGDEGDGAGAEDAAGTGDEDGDGAAGEDVEEAEPEVVSPDADPEVLNVEEADDDDGPSVVLLVLVFVVLAAVVAGAFWLVMSRRQASGSGPDASSDTDTGSDASDGSDTPDEDT